MRNFLSNLTAALLALHTVLGCCWHHEHRCAEACSLAVAAESSHCCDADHSPGDGATIGVQGHAQHGLHECLGAACNFVGPTKQKPHHRSSPTQAAPASCGVTTFLAADSRQLFCCNALPPSLPLHLIHQVLLI
jgi:hypothetical protein